MVYNELLMQFQADILGVPVVRPVVANNRNGLLTRRLAVGFGRRSRICGELGKDKQWEPKMHADNATRCKKIG